LKRAECKILWQGRIKTALSIKKGGAVFCIIIGNTGVILSTGIGAVCFYCFWNRGVLWR